MALTKVDDRGLKTPIDLLDNEKIRLGAGNDLQIYHDGTNSVLSNATGTLYYLAGTQQIMNLGGTETMAKFTENGAVELYYDNTRKAYTSSDGFRLDDNLRLDDSKEIRLGTGEDLKIYHNGTHSYILNTTGVLKVGDDSEIVLGKQSADVNYIKAFGDGAVELYYNNVKQFETYNGGVWIPDGTFYASGADKDVAIGHNTTNYITYKNADLLITGDASNQVKIMPKSDETAAVFKPNDCVELYYNNTKRFQTLSDGAEVKGVLHVLSEDGNVHTHTEAYYLSIATSTTKTITLTGLNGTAKFTCGGYANAGQGAIALQIIFGGGMYATQHYDVQVLQNNAMQNTSISLTKNGTSYVIAIENSSSSWALNLSMSVESTGAEMGLAIS